MLYSYPGGFENTRSVLRPLAVASSSICFLRDFLLSSELSELLLLLWASSVSSPPSTTGTFS